MKKMIIKLGLVAVLFVTFTFTASAAPVDPQGCAQLAKCWEWL